MSCDVAVSAALLLASLNPGHATAPRLIPAVATAPAAASPLLKEPLFASIVGEAKALGKTVDGYVAGLKDAKDAKPLPGLDKFEKRVTALSALDMKGHLELAARGTDGDLKCILRGISQDLPRKLDDLMKADAPAKQEIALKEMGYLLNDNVEVITTPASVQSDSPA
jgi:hypothetical protein